MSYDACVFASWIICCNSKSFMNETSGNKKFCNFLMQMSKAWGVANFEVPLESISIENILKRTLQKMVSKKWEGKRDSWIYHWEPWAPLFVSLLDYVQEKVGKVCHILSNFREGILFIYLANDKVDWEALDFLKIKIMMLEFIESITIFRPDSKHFAISLRPNIN